MIDIHTHIGRLIYGKKFLTPASMVRFMDKNKIDKAVLLPIENPEEIDYYVTTKEILRASRRYPDRLIPFCNVDPRRSMNDGRWNPEPIIKEYIDQGCRGFGEVLANLKVNDPRMKNIFRACGKLKIPVLLHIQKYTLGLYDEIGLPYLEEVLKEFPGTSIIVHGPGFWAEMSAGDARDKYGSVAPDKKGLFGKIRKPGRIDYLLGKYPNLYGDFSAGSGYTGLSRDPEYSKGFLKRHAQQLLFGTDYLGPGQETPIIEFIRNIGLDQKTFRLVTEDNARRLLRL